MKRTNVVLCALLSILLSGAGVQTGFGQRREGPPPVVSPQVHDDGRVTLSLRAPKAEKVIVESGEIQRALGASLKPMEKAENGVWRVTLGPLDPGIYDYYFVVDGLRITDPASPHVFGNRQGSRGYLEVPGPPGQPRHDEWRDVPHGAVTAHWYPSSTTGQRRRLHVYTPPGYQRHRWKSYPVMLLLHGAGDNDSHWTLLGRAHVILDNLIADGKARPMLVVMPDGHVNVPRGDLDLEQWRARSSEAFEKEMLTDILPFVESHYRVSRRRSHRAIVGLSMGGGQSLRVGLNHLDRFAWVGGFSSAVRGLDSILDKLAADPKRTNKQLQLLWIGIGEDDFLIQRNREMIQSLKEKGIEHEYHETAGAHMWSVWRRYLAEFAPRLFR